MTENIQTAPILTVTWDTVIGSRHVGYDPDSGPEVEPVSLGEMVVAGIVDRLTGDIKRDADSYRDAVREARDAANEAVKAEAAALVKRALAEGVQRTNTWGEPQGEKVTLRDLILDEIRKYLDEKPPRPGYSERERPGGFVELLRHEVAAGMQRELAEEIKAARAQVAAKVRERAAELIGDVVKAQTR